MKNFEYFEKEIKELNLGFDDIAVVNNKPCRCCGTACGRCQLYTKSEEPSYCSMGLLNWLYEEHIEQPKISERTKKFFEAIQTGWVARDYGEGGELCFYSVKPVKLGNVLHWDYYVEDTCSSNLLPFDFLTLNFIKWEDEEPWRVEDILKLEVEG